MINHVKARPILLAAFVACTLAGCDRDEAPGKNPVSFSAEERRAILKLSPLPPPPPNPTNAFADNPEAARLGQYLFYDARLSANGAIACATCHDPSQGFSDGKALSEGLQTTDRHSPGLWNVAYQRWYFWDGRADSLWAQSVQPLFSEKEMGATPALILDVSGDAHLKEAYESVFGPVPAAGSTGEKPMNRFLSNLGKSIEAYQRRIISTDSSFDRFVTQLKENGAENPEEGPISLSAQRGLKLFVGRGQCVLCHAGPNLSDGEFHNIGLPRIATARPDQGRFTGIRKLEADPFNGMGDYSDDPSPHANVKLRYLVQKLNNLGEFKTPSLRHVAQTAPYMHDGRFATLGEVLDYYSELPGEPVYGHQEETLEPLQFTEKEKEDLEAFLNTLTGAPLDESLTGPPPDQLRTTAN